MSPSAKKRPKGRVVFKMQDEEPQEKIQQALSKVTKWNRLKMMIKNLSLLRLLKTSNPRIKKLYNLANRYRNSVLEVPVVFLISSGNNTASDKVHQSSGEPYRARCSKKQRESKKLEATGKPAESKPKSKAQQSHAALPKTDREVELETTGTSRAHGLTICPGARGRQLPADQVVCLKTQPQGTAMGDAKQLEAADQWIWFEGLPTRVHLPGPRVMCRSSTQRLVKRCCTRFCSASLELPMYHPYRV